MSRLAHQAELLKLSRLLDLSPAELPMLATMPPAAIRQLRERIDCLDVRPHDPKPPIFQRF